VQKTFVHGGIRVDARKLNWYLACVYVGKCVHEGVMYVRYVRYVM